MSILDFFLRLFGLRNATDYQLTFGLEPDTVVGTAMCPYSLLTGTTNDSKCVPATLLRNGTVRCTRCKRTGTVIPHKYFDILQYSADIRPIIAEFLCPKSGNLAPLYLFGINYRDGVQLKPTLKSDSYHGPFHLEIGKTLLGYPLDHNLTDQDPGYAIPSDIKQIIEKLISLGFELYGVNFNYITHGELPKMVFIKRLAVETTDSNRQPIIAAEILWPRRQ